MVSQLLALSSSPAIAIDRIDPHDVKKREVRKAGQAAAPLLNHKNSIESGHRGVRVIDTNLLTAGELHDKRLKGSAL